VLDKIWGRKMEGRGKDKAEVIQEYKAVTEYIGVLVDSIIQVLRIVMYKKNIIRYFQGLRNGNGCCQ